MSRMTDLQTQTEHVKASLFTHVIHTHSLSKTSPQLHTLQYNTCTIMKVGTNSKSTFYMQSWRPEQAQGWLVVEGKAFKVTQYMYMYAYL